MSAGGPPGSGPWSAGSHGSAGKAWAAGSPPVAAPGGRRGPVGPRRWLIAAAIGVLLLVVLPVAWSVVDVPGAVDGRAVTGPPASGSAPEGDRDDQQVPDEHPTDRPPPPSDPDAADDDADDASNDDANDDADDAIGSGDDPADAAGAADDLVVLFLDVGQGDATLLVQGGTTVLIDTGRYQASDVVETVQTLGIDTLDLVVVTHPHADHIGQFDRLVDAVTITETWWSGATTTSLTFGRALDALERSGAAYEEPRSGDAAVIGDLLLEVVNPPVGVDLTDVHDSGLAVRVTYGSFRVLFTGDAEAPTEGRMVASDPALLEAEVLQVGHHGSRTSTVPEFLAAVSPEVAVYSAGVGNPYGHPHPEVIERLRAADIEVYGTELHGTVAISSDGQRWSVQTGWEPATQGQEDEP